MSIDPFSLVTRPQDDRGNDVVRPADISWQMRSTLICISISYHVRAIPRSHSKESGIHPLSKMLNKGASMSHVPDVNGSAALAICESLLLALNDRNILPEREIVGILKDASAAHTDDPGGDGLTDHHRAVAALIDGILAGGNSVRRR